MIRTVRMAREVLRRWPADLARLYGYVRPYRWRLVGLVLTMAIVGATNAGLTYLIQTVMDTLIIALDFRRLPLVVAAVAGLYVIRSIGAYYSQATSRWIGAQVVYRMRQRVFAHVLEQPPLYFREFSTGQIVNRMVTDGTMLQQGLTEVLIDILLESFKTIAVLGYILWLNWRMAVFAVLVIPVIVIPIGYLGHRLRQVTEIYHDRLDRLSHYLWHLLRGLSIVQAYRGEPHETRRFRTHNEAVLTTQRRWIFWQALHSPLIEICLGGVLLSLIVYGAHQIRRGHLTPGGFMAFIAAMLMVYTPLRRMSKVNALLQQTATAADRLEALLALDARLPMPQPPIRLARVEGAVQFERVTFVYPGTRQPVLRDIDLAVAPGEVIAIVGPSGAGKSTLVQLIPRFMDVTTGTVRLDGYDVRQIDLRDLRTHVAWVPQDVFLFPDTVFANIAYGLPDAAEADVVRAARQAHADGFIRALPRGYATVVGGDRLRLSGGQAQRIALARALVRNPAVLILDEVTSALDSESEAQILAALGELKGRCTMIIITHRASMLQLADRIVVLDLGEIVDQGRHEELIERCGLYRRLVRRQQQPYWEMADRRVK